MPADRDLAVYGNRILEYVRTELYLSMRFMGDALSAFDFVMDLRTRSVGTDAVSLRFNPMYLREMFLSEPRFLNRAYLHMVLHCLFRHPFTAVSFPSAPVSITPDRIVFLEEEMASERGRLFDLCADIAVESIIDTMHYPAIDRVVSDVREYWYRRLTEAVQVLTAEKLCDHLLHHPLTLDELETLEGVFRVDDHGFWLHEPEDVQDEEHPPVPEALSMRHSAAEGWEKRARKMQSEMQVMGDAAGSDTGDLMKLMRFTYETKTDYREFLKRFTILREEAAIDPDSFDYGFYNYGLELYGNMPLIEENEYREAHKIEQLVIAIDTSASCDGEKVQQFLNETAAMLMQKERFFRKVEIHIIECDERIQKDITIHDIDEMKSYADAFEVHGGYGTDFRPVFQYVDELRREGALPHLRGLIYFTDGFGTYPTLPSDYDTAFLFKKDVPAGDAAAPAWATKIFI